MLALQDHEDALGAEAWLADLRPDWPLRHSVELLDAHEARGMLRVWRRGRSSGEAATAGGPAGAGLIGRSPGRLKLSTQPPAGPGAAGMLGRNLEAEAAMERGGGLAQRG